MSDHIPLPKKNQPTTIKTYINWQINKQEDDTFLNLPHTNRLILSQTTELYFTSILWIIIVILALICML